ncbi:MAG: AMP-binding protein [Alkalilacustris sp.]
MAGDRHAFPDLRDGRSHVTGADWPPLLELTIPQLLARTADRWPERPAAVFAETGLRLTWAELAARVDRLAAGLLRMGLGRGDRLGIWAPNRVEWLLTQFATARIGVLLVTINPAYRLQELEFALAKTGCRALILAERFKTSDYTAMLARLLPELGQAAPGHLRADRLPDLRLAVTCGTARHPGCLRFSDLEEAGTGHDAAALQALSDRLDPRDAINIQFTSGTTGSPKGATLSHRNIVNNANAVTAAMALTEADRLCIPVPFYHCFGMVMGTLGCVTKGAAMVIPGEGFDALQTLDAVATERATALYGVPTMFVAMLEHPRFGDFDLSSLRTGIMAGAPCPIEVMKRVQRDMHMSGVTIAYGMTETSPVSFQSAPDTPLDKRVASVGRIQPHLEVKVVDAYGAIVPLGTEGELMTRGYSVMQGYWADPERTAEVLDAEGWMRTGDLGRIDAEGYCNITGRVKELIIRGGENIAPREIEEFLFTHPAVSMVQVFGIPDARFGEIVCAWIVPKPGTAPTEEDIRAFCRERIAHYKIPAVIRFRSELPMTVTGKPQKFLMRAAMIEELDLVVDATA